MPSDIKSHNGILVVEDEASIRDLYLDSLSAHGFEVVTADNGQEGIDSHAVGHHPVALVDIGLPDMSGIDVVRQIKEQNRLTVVLMATGDRSQNSLIKAMQAGASDYLIKPIGVEHLIDRIQHARAVYEQNATPNAGLRSAVHDMNNSLSPVLGYSELALMLEHTNLTEKQVMFFETIHDSAVTLQDQIAGMQQYLVRDDPISSSTSNNLYSEVDLESLTGDALQYTIVHVEDKPEMASFVRTHIDSSSNIGAGNAVPGVYGHGGKKISYRLFQYASVEDFIEARKKGEMGRVDCLLLDNNLGEGHLTGLQFLSLMQEDGADEVKRKPEFSDIGPVVMHTAGATESTRNEIERLGAQYHAKELSSRELEPRIYKAIVSGAR
tara:strand:+ start:4535 stop:5677 length:1143 start_codon:yes stop_codon:yes gene_type:complete